MTVMAEGSLHCSGDMQTIEHGGDCGEMRDLAFGGDVGKANQPGNRKSIQCYQLLFFRINSKYQMLIL